MENENVTITLTVAQWQSLLNVIGAAPYVAVNSIGETVNSLQSQAGEQMSLLAEKFSSSDETLGTA